VLSFHLITIAIEMGRQKLSKLYLNLNGLRQNKDKWVKAKHISNSHFLYKIQSVMVLPAFVH